MFVVIWFVNKNKYAIWTTFRFIFLIAMFIQWDKILRSWKFEQIAQYMNKEYDLYFS